MLQNDNLKGGCKRIAQGKQEIEHALDGIQIGIGVHCLFSRA